MYIIQRIKSQSLELWWLRPELLPEDGKGTDY
jgi:hypothetical protein